MDKDFKKSVNDNLREIKFELISMREQVTKCREAIALLRGKNAAWASIVATIVTVIGWLVTRG